MGEKQAVSRGMIVGSGTSLSIYAASTRLDSSRYLLDHPVDEDLHVEGLLHLVVSDMLPQSC